MRTSSLRIIVMNTSSSTRKPSRDKKRSPRKFCRLQWRSNWILRLLCSNKLSRIAQSTYHLWMICLMKPVIYKALIRVKPRPWSSLQSTCVRFFCMLSPTCFSCPITSAMKNLRMGLTYFSQAVNVFLPISAATRTFALRRLKTRTICKIGSHYSICSVLIRWLWSHLICFFTVEWLLVHLPLLLWVTSMGGNFISRSQLPYASSSMCYFSTAKITMIFTIACSSMESACP